MIFDQIKNADNYKDLHMVYSALNFLKGKKFGDMPEGKHVLNDNIYYLVQEYYTHMESLYSEAHEKYIDIQFLVSGNEKIGIAPLTSDKKAVKSMPEKDMWNYNNCKMQFLTLSTGDFMVLFPNDIHMPGIISGKEPVLCKKVVVKVKIDSLIEL